MPWDVRIYAAHALCWLIFFAGNLLARRTAPRDAVGVGDATPAPTSTDVPLRAKHPALLVGVHFVAFAVLYFGIERAVFRSGDVARSNVWRLVGFVVIVLGGLLMAWARMSFASWRIRAQLDAGHQLATGGPFAIVRHPIYAGLNLLALGTAIWLPSPFTWAGVLLMVLGGDLRARAEEPLLEARFGDVYREYRARTSRFVPGVY